MYIPTMKHLTDHEKKTNALSGPFNVATVSAALKARLQDGAERDRNGKAALAAVLALSTDPRFADRPLSSVRARILKELGEGWGVDQYGNLRSPQGQTVWIQGGIISKQRLEDSNTCHTVGADGRLAAVADALALVPEIARAMVTLANQTADLHAKLNGNPYIEFDPWYLIANHLKAGG